MKEEKIDLAIQIVNYNTKAYLLECLKSVFRDLEGSRLSVRIFILDNDSEDDLWDLKKNFVYFQAENIRTLESEKNLGFGAGHNFLAAQHHIPKILILNPDVFIEGRGNIEAMYRRLISDPLVKVIGPKLYNTKGKAQVWDHGEKGRLADILMEIGLSRWKKRDTETICAWVSGAALLIDHEIFDQIGGFDDKFFLYKEEEDLCLRIRRLGGQILYYPEVQIMHIGSVVANKKKYFKASWRYFLQKHPLGTRSS